VVNVVVVAVVDVAVTGIVVVDVARRVVVTVLGWPVVTTTGTVVWTVTVVVGPVVTNSVAVVVPVVAVTVTAWLSGAAPTNGASRVSNSNPTTRGNVTTSHRQNKPRSIIVSVVLLDAGWADHTAT